MGNEQQSVYSALIVDDNIDNRQLFCAALGSVDYKTSVARDGVEALSILATQPFDLIVLDLQMPLVSGSTVLKSIRLNPIHERAAVIVATANSHMAVVDVQDLADYVLYKPLDIREFIRLAERLKGTFRPLPATT